MTDLNNNTTIIWKDRPRKFGLPLSFTRYYIKNKRLYLSEGFFSSTENELLMYRILDISFKSSLFDKIFNVGTITLFTCDESHKQLILKKVKNPKKVRNLISQIVEEERTKINIRGKELYGVSDDE